MDRPPSAPTSVSISSGTYPTPVASFAAPARREIRPPFAAAQNDPANATEETSSRRLRTERRPRNLPPNVSERVLRKRTRRRNRRRKRRRRVLVLVEESASSTSPPPPPPPPTRAEATSRGASAITVDSRTTFSRRNGADSARDENLPPRSPSPARASSRSRVSPRRLRTRPRRGPRGILVAFARPRRTRPRTRRVRLFRRRLFRRRRSLHPPRPLPSLPSSFPFALGSPRSRSRAPSTRVRIPATPPRASRRVIPRRRVKTRGDPERRRGRARPPLSVRSRVARVPRFSLLFKRALRRSNAAASSS